MMLSNSEALPERESVFAFTMRLEDALVKKKPFFTYNHDVRRAFVIIVSAFLHAECEILLLSHELESIIYCHRSLLIAIKDFLNTRKGRLRVLVEGPIHPEHPFRELAESMPDQVSIRRVPREEQDCDFNFLVMDDCGFRFVQRRASWAASFHFCSGNTREIVNNLRERFEALSAKSVSLDVEEPAF